MAGVLGKGSNVMKQEHNDTRIVCGANCIWWDSIDKVGSLTAKSGFSIPCCPHCHSVLYEMPSIESWWEMVDTYEKAGNPGYRTFIEWLRGKCFKTIQQGKAAYEANKSADQLRKQS